MLEMEQIRENIIKMRKTYRVSQKELAEKVTEELQRHIEKGHPVRFDGSFGQSTISDIENGKRDITIIELAAISQAFNKLAKFPEFTILPSDLLKNIGGR